MMLTRGLLDPVCSGTLRHSARVRQPKKTVYTAVQVAGRCAQERHFPAILSAWRDTRRRLYAGVRMTVKASRSAAMTVPPFNTPRRPSMWAVGQSEDCTVCAHLAAFAVALAQQDRAGGEFRFRTASTYMPHHAHPAKAYKSQIWNYMATT